ncbi:MAG: hypothetical protein FWF15_09450 [Oscillospiraceae bacterium]|nr:hypothetical protein [Oscillospiraceae bacterium]
MNNIKNQTMKFIRSFVTVGIIFILSFSLCLLVYNLVADGHSYTIAIQLTMAVVAIISLIGTFIISVRFADASKLKNPAANPPRDVAFYFKRMAFIIVITILISAAASVIGTFANSFFGGVLNDNIDSMFTRGLILKLPVFIIYLMFLYKFFKREGYTDSKSRMFNLNLIIFSIIIALTLMLPYAIRDIMFYADTFDAFLINIQTVFSSNIGMYTMEYGSYIANEHFNILLIIISMLVTFSLQVGVAYIAYIRGKQNLQNEQIQKLDEFEINENVF